MIHVIVENESAYRFLRHGRFAGKDVTWHTTSPWLLEKLPQLGEKVLSLEEQSRLEDRDRLCWASMDFADTIADYLDKICAPFADGLKVGQAMRREIQVNSYALLYKGMLFDMWQKDFRSSEGLAVVGNKDLIQLQAFSLMVGRFDTLFAAIAAGANIEGVEFIHHAAGQGEEIIKKINREDIGATEKILYFLNTDLSAFLYFLWGALRKRNIFKTNFLKWGRSNNDQTVYFLRRCELLYETFLPLLKKGVGIAQMNARFDTGIQKAPTPSLEIDLKELQVKITETLRESFYGQGITFNNSYEACAEIFYRRFVDALAYTKSLIQVLPTTFKAYQQYQSNHTALATNVLMRYSERLLQQYLINQGIPVFSMEHGVTAGLEGKTEDCHHRLDATVGGDDMVCFSETSLKLHCIDREQKQGIAAGAPSVNRSIPYYPVQRFIARRKLGLKNKERVIFYLALVARNNQVVGPKYYTDLEFYRYTKKLTTEVFSDIKDPCIFKLYPASRYLDADPFGELIKMPSNVKVLQYFEFSLLRAAADVVILSSPQSTFGWACSIRSRKK